MPLQCNSTRPTRYQTPDDSPSAAREALRQVNLVMEQVKVMHEASQVAYNASSALQTNVQVSKTPTELLNVELYPITHWGVSLLRAWEIFHVTRLDLNLSRLSESVGACRVHPLGVVPETTVDCWQSTGV